MDTPQGHEENADQIAYWNGPGGQRWADRQAAQDILLKPIADLLVDRAKPKTGERVIDVGCGSGAIKKGFSRGSRQQAKASRPDARSARRMFENDSTGSAKNITPNREASRSKLAGSNG